MFLAAFFLLIGGVRPVAAIPTLQLDIRGGFYDRDDETIISTAANFTLYAYLIPDGETPDSKAPLSDIYYLSVAVVPALGPDDRNLGSFIINGQTINVTEDMTYGTPPLDSTDHHDPGDLGTHSVYPTFYAQFAFQFNPNHRAVAYNTAETPGLGPTRSATGAMYFARFDIQMDGLLPADYGLHFDLYNTRSGRGDDIDIKTFAPFSHDAASCGGLGRFPCGPSAVIPEPAALSLVASGLAAFALRRRRRTLARRDP